MPFISKRRDVSAAIIIGALIVAIIVTALLIIAPNLNKTTTVWLGDGIFQANVASTDAARVKGLSGVTRLGSQQALLMVFPTEGKWQIWMKDMKVPIDIVWLNKDKKVIYIVKDATPDDSTSVVFTPKSDALYVLELPAGSVEHKAISVNRTALFDASGGQ